MRRPLMLCAALAGGACAAAPGTPPLVAGEPTAEWYLECWGHYNAARWDAFKACYAEQATAIRVDSSQPAFTGREAIVAQAMSESGAYPDRVGEPVLVLVHGDSVVSTAIYGGTFTGPLIGPGGQPITPTGRRFGVPIAHRVTVNREHHVATRDWFYLDEGTLMAQLGLADMPARASMPAGGRKPEVVVAQQDERERRNVDRVREMFAAVNTHDRGALEQILSPAYRLMEVPRPSDLNRSEALASFDEVMRAVPDFTITVDEVWGAGPYVVAAGVVSGTQSGAWPALKLPASGRTLRVHFLEVFRLADNLIEQDWLYYNGAALSAQLR